MSERDDRIRAKAHELWLAEGSPEGRASDHWRQARAMVEQEDAAGQTFPPAGPHAKPGLTNDTSTPGSGMLPEIGSDDPDQQPSG